MIEGEMRLVIALARLTLKSLNKHCGTGYLNLFSSYRIFIMTLSSAFVVCLMVLIVFLYIDVVYWCNPKLLHPDVVGKYMGQICNIERFWVQVLS